MSFATSSVTMNCHPFSVDMRIQDTFRDIDIWYVGPMKTQ
jgi:hypothetical protein